MSDAMDAMGAPEPRENDPPETPVAPPPPPPPPPPEPAPLPAARAALWKAVEQDCEQGGGKATAEELREQIRATPAGIAPGGEGFRKVTFELRLKFSDYSARYNAHNGEQIAMSFPALAEKPGNAMTIDEGVKAAQELLAPPPGANLEMAQYDEADGAPFFVVVWRHVEGGVPVERDQILAMVNGRSKRVFTWQRVWHRVNPAAGPR